MKLLRFGTGCRYHTILLSMERFYCLHSHSPPGQEPYEHIKGQIFCSKECWEKENFKTFAPLDTITGAIGRAKTGSSRSRTPSPPLQRDGHVHNLLAIKKLDELTIETRRTEPRLTSSHLPPLPYRSPDVHREAKSHSSPLLPSVDHNNSGSGGTHIHGRSFIDDEEHTDFTHEVPPSRLDFNKGRDEKHPPRDDVVPAKHSPSQKTLLPVVAEQKRSFVGHLPHLEKEGSPSSHPVPVLPDASHRHAPQLVHLDHEFIVHHTHTTREFSSHKLEMNKLTLDDSLLDKHHLPVHLNDHLSDHK